jgi:DNA-binding Lrp family transcriptional regulator
MEPKRELDAVDRQILEAISESMSENRLNIDGWVPLHMLRAFFHYSDSTIRKRVRWLVDNGHLEEKRYYPGSRFRLLRLDPLEQHVRIALKNQKKS